MKPIKVTKWHSYIDVHNLPGVKAGDVAETHLRDLQEQEKYGVRYLRYWRYWRYWVNENETPIPVDIPRNLRYNPHAT